MTKEDQNVKLLSRKVVLSWKKATESSDISWSEIFPIICALYELDNNFQNDNSFKRLNVEKSLFYTKFQKTLESLNLSHHNIHYFRRDTKHLLKTFIEVNRGIRKLQDNGNGTEENEYHATKKIKGQEIKVITKSKKKYEVSADESLIPNVIIDEVVNFYIKLKKADSYETVSAKSKANESIISINNHRRTKSAPRTISTMKVPVNDIKEVKEIKPSEIRTNRRALPPLPKSPIYTPNFTSRYSPKFSPLVPPSVSPILTPSFSPPPSYNESKKFTPPANANVITVKHPKIINLRKIKKKPLKINTNNNDPEEMIISPHDSPISPPKQFYPMEEDLQSAGLSITSPSLVNAPKRTASLKPSPKRLSYGRKAISCISHYDDNRYPSPTNSYVSSKHYSSVLSPNTKSFVLSPSSRTVNSISPPSVSPSYSEASAPAVLCEKENHRSFCGSKVYRKVKSMCSFHKTPTFLPSEDNLPVIPPITPNYTEEIAPTVSKFNPTVTEDSTGFPLPPLNETENLELVSISPCLSSRFSSPTIQVPSYRNSAVLNTPMKKKAAEEDEDLSEIIDIYGDDKPVINTNTKHISDIISPTLFSSSTSSPHPSIFKNNGLTMEGIKYTHRNSMSSGINPLDILMFKESSEGEDREAEMVEHFKELMQIGEMKGHSVLNGNADSLEPQPQQPSQEEEAISTTITDVGVIDGLEEDLLNHKVSQRRKSTNSIHSRRSLRSMNSANSRRSSIMNTDQSRNEKTKSMLIVEKKEVDKTQSTPKDQDNKNQFRLSLLTNKAIPNLENSSKDDTKMDSGMQPISENKNEEIKMEEIKIEENKIEEIKNEPTTIQPTNLSTFGRGAKGDKSPKIKTNRRNSSAVPSSQVEERVFPVFVHPIQLYNIIKMINTYTVNRLPHSAQPITEHWITSSNEVSKKLWEQLKEKEDVISQMIVYATFYDHVKGTTFPLNDPEHVFLKELVSSATYVEDLKELPTSPSFKNKRYSFLGKDKEGYENQLFNRNLIMEIKKELYI